MGSGLLSLVARGVLESIDYAADLVKAKLGEQERDGIDRVLPYGFAHHPHPGAQVYALSPNGSTSQAFIFCVADRRYQVDLDEGEVAICNSEGANVVLKANGDVQVTAPGKILLGEGADDPVVRKSDLEAAVAADNGHTHDVVISGGSSAGTYTTTAGPTHTATASSKVDAV